MPWYIPAAIYLVACMFLTLALIEWQQSRCTHDFKRQMCKGELHADCDPCFWMCRKCHLVTEEPNPSTVG